MIAAACITDELPQQIEIAASLLGLELDAATTKALSAAKPRGSVIDINGRGGAQRTVVVEKKRVIRASAAASSIGTGPRAFAGQLTLNRA